MNLCRSCKHWALNEHTLGLGLCTSIEVHLRTNPSGVRTTQDFGCILHEPGCFASIYAPDERGRILKDGAGFILSEPEKQP